MMNDNGRELSNELPRIEALVNEGRLVDISQMEKVIPTIEPAAMQAGERRAPKPDIMKRLNETWGERIFSMQEVAAMRVDELAADLG
jgi:hypothetical protein